MGKAREDVTWFDSPAAWRAWLDRNHASESEIWLGLRKKHVERGVSYDEALDEALCYGWIDGITHGVDADGYTVRFTPRKASSLWSAVNLAHVERLREQGRMHESGLRAWERRDPSKVATAASDREGVELDPVFEARFRARPEAWAWFQSCPPGYRQRAVWWVMSAKRAETRERRLHTLIEESSAGRRVTSAG